MDRVWTLLSNRLSTLLRRIVFENLLTDSVRDQVIERLLQRINLPFIDQDTKVDLFTLIWDTAVEALAEVLGADIDDPEYDRLVSSLNERIEKQYGNQA